MKFLGVACMRLETSLITFLPLDAEIFMMRHSILTVPVALLAAASIYPASAASAAEIAFDGFSRTQALSAAGQTFTDVGGVTGLDVNVKATGDFLNTNYPAAIDVDGDGDHETLRNYTTAGGSTQFVLTFSQPVNIEATSPNHIYDGSHGREKITLSADAGGIFTANDVAVRGFEGSGQTISTTAYDLTAPAGEPVLSALGTNITSFTWDYDNAVDTYSYQGLSVNVVVPEPASVGLMILGALGLVYRRRRVHCSA